MQRVTATTHRMIPDGTIAITSGVDTSNLLLHWVVEAIDTDGRIKVIDYGEQPTEAKAIGVERGLIEALQKLREHFNSAYRDASGEVWQPHQVWIDSGYHAHQPGVYGFCQWANEQERRELGDEIYRPCKGFGEGQKMMSRYIRPPEINKRTLYIGDGTDFNWQSGAGIILVQLNSDQWKYRVHEGLSLPPDTPGSLALYKSPDPHEHKEWTDQVLAERQIEKWFEGRGFVVVFERTRRQNHYLDATYQAAAAANFVREMLAVPAEPGPQDDGPIIDLGALYR